MAYTLRINDRYIESTVLDITDLVADYYIQSNDGGSHELIVHSDNRYRSRGPGLDLSVIDSRYTVLELTGVSVYNTIDLHYSVTILDVHNAGDLCGCRYTDQYSTYSRYDRAVPHILQTDRQYTSIY